MGVNNVSFVSIDDKIKALDMSENSAAKSETSDEQKYLNDAEKTNENDAVEVDSSATITTSHLNMMLKQQNVQKQIRELRKKEMELQRELRSAESDKKTKIRKEIRNINTQIYKLNSELRTSAANQSANLLLTSLMSASSSTSGSSTTTSSGASSVSDGNFDTMLSYVLQYEGGYVNDPYDRGGATNKGITQSTYNSWLKSQGLPAKDVRNITDSEVKEIYYKNYYVASGASEYSKTNPQLAFAIFDAAVNHGVYKAKDMLKKSGGDVDKFMEIRKNYYIAIVANNPSQKRFAKGWQNRWNKVYSVINPNHQYENYINA